MNKKGQTGMVGAMLLAAILVIAGLVFYQETNVYIGTATQTIVANNQTITMPANGGTLELRGQNIVGSATITNATNATQEAVPATNYTIAQAIGADGLTATVITANLGPWNSKSVNVSYTYEPDGYVSSSGARSVALIIPIFFALLIAVIALVPALRNGVIDLVT